MEFNFYKHALVSTVLISSAYATENLSIEQAHKLLFEKADRLEESKIKLTSDQRDLIKNLSGVRQKNSELEAWKAFSEGQLLGWIVVDEVIGKHEFITFATAINTSGEVAGVEVLTYRETHGHEIKRKDWRDKFKKKKITDPFKLDVDIPNISGATLSSRNLTDGVKRILAIHKVILSK